MQLPWDYSPRHSKQLASVVNQTKGADLVVFPECMPFGDDKRPVTHEMALAHLSDAGRASGESTFIAGGYVRDGDYTRNRVYLTSRGEVKKWYDKQIVWTGENFTAGNCAETFDWGSDKCVPLICADAGDNLTPRKVRMMAAALAAGAGPNVPIVISSYGGGLMTDYWRPALREWSKGCKAPVVICGIAGLHPDLSYDYMGGKHPFGGGGSGVFWPNGYELQVAYEGILTVDLKQKTIEHKEFKKS